MKLELLNFPKYEFRIQSKENLNFIWDDIRKKFLVLTPEEWVRQHVLQFLIREKKYSPHWMAVEKQFTINGIHKRADVVVFNHQMNPYIMVECKAPSVKITQETFDQIARYNLALDAKFLMLTNGIQHYYCQMNFEKETYIFLQDIPNFIVEK